MIKLDDTLFAQLAAQAAVSPRKRQHLNLHASHDEPCQKLLNALEHDSYIRPHRHSVDPKPECIVALKGRFGCVLFDDHGEPARVLVLGPDQSCMGVQIEPGRWHTLFALDQMGILLEVKSGPFDPSAAKEFAPWAAAEGSPDAPAYLAWLRSLVPVG